MFGTKLRSWMEAHIVRSRKKQQRTKDNPTNGKHQPRGSAPDTTANVRKCEENVEVKGNKDGEKTVVPMAGVGGLKGVAGTTVQNLSSPESAYSTGYSTDGTSPGASIPPEYYINLRTGTHYVHANTGNTTVLGGPGPALTPRSARRRREEALKRKRPDGLPESSTEEDIADRPNKPQPPHKVPTPKSQRKLLIPPPTGNNSFHRRTESCDESVRPVVGPCTERDSEGSSSTQTGASLSCQSPFLSTASPRQRNRIRTNPWLGAAPERAKSYISQGETSSTVGSSSTLSSSGCKERVPREDSHLSFSPKPQNKKLEDLKNLNVFRSPTHSSPLSNSRKALATVTTCSPLPNRPCRHFRPGTSSSSSSAPSSGSDDNHHGNTSDFSDDDVTLNEMLGKYDESYIYEKETDILSDSDPTDCEDQHDYNDNSSRLTDEQQGNSDLDFIDTGSLAELANSDSECSGKVQNQGHCSYYNVAGHTPDMCRRQCSRVRRSLGGDGGSGASSRGSSISNRRFRKSASRQNEELSASTDGLPKRYSSRKKLRQHSRERKCSPDNKPKVFPRNSQICNLKSAPMKDIDGKVLEQGKHINLNRVLMERLIHNQRSGTRSADGTPVSLRRNGPHDYNGKYLRNPHVSKLINSNSGLTERRTSVGESNKNQTKKDIFVVKKRSNSLTGYTNANPPPVPPRNPPKGANSLDKEGDIKYRQLIQEAETILEDYKVKTTRHEYLSPTMSTKSAIYPNPNKSPSPLPFNIYENECDMHSQLSMLEEKINNNPIPKTDNEESIFKAISKTLEKIIIRGDSRKTDKSLESLKGKKKNSFGIHMNGNGNTIDTNEEYFSHPVNTNLRHSSEVLTTTDKNENIFTNKFTPTLRMRSPKQDGPQTFHRSQMGNMENGEMDRFRRNNKGIDIIRGTDPICSSSNLSPKVVHTMHNMNAKAGKSWQDNRNENIIEETYLQRQTEQTNQGTFVQSSLVSFKSFDLGNQIAVSSRYCPQSEPVKRKVYVGSSTFGKLQKSLMRKSPEKRYNATDMTTDDLRDENETLKGKVAQLRRERLQVEARVRETQEQIDRLKLTDASNHC